MSKELLNDLILASYKKNRLDAKRVEKIATLLSRSDLKLYIQALKLEERKHEISVVLPSKSLYNSTRKSIQKIFKNKKVDVRQDPSLLLGLKVIDADMVYELSLSQRLKEILSDANQTYDD